MYVVRPAISADHAALIALARQAGPGFTSLAVDDAALATRLKKSEVSFASHSEISPDHAYLLMLEDVATGKVVGLSAIKAQIGIRDPFFNFRILKIAQKSNVTQKRFDMDVLVLVNENGGATEVGSLFVQSSARGTGAGRLISQARYMLMAADEARFSDKVISELRGHVDDKGYSPFWEAIGRQFFQMDFNEADQISAKKDNQFILDLMPKYPIYAALLPETAQAVIGQTHPQGVGARRYLEAEGFRHDGVIDIFDGGPTMSAPRKEIRTIRNSRRLPVYADKGEFPLTALISNDKVKDFRCVLAHLRFDDDRPVVSQDVLNILGAKEGDTLRIWIKR